MSALRPSRLLALLLALLLPWLLTACKDPEAADLMLEMAAEWAQEKGLLACVDETADPAICELGPSWVRIGTYAAGWGQDPNVQAMFDTGKTVLTIEQADGLAEDGFADRDAAKMEEAIKLRPDDWAYREQLGVLLLLDGDQQAASSARLDAEEQAQNHVAATMNGEGLSQGDPDALKVCDRTYFNLYTHRENALLAQIEIEDAKEAPDDNLMTTLIREIDLVRRSIADLSDNNVRSPCNGYGPAQ